MVFLLIDVGPGRAPRKRYLRFSPPPITPFFAGKFGWRGAARRERLARGQHREDRECLM
jgi:hypothetical protein